MLRRCPAFWQAARLALTYTDGDYVTLEQQILSLFAADQQERDPSVPAYTKERFSFNAMTPKEEVCASVSGYTAWGEAHVDMLCTSPHVCVPGAGKALMRRVEEFARERHCTRVGLDTYSWQARPFYEKLGFSVFATQRNYPVGHERYFLEKLCSTDRPSGKADHASTGGAVAAETLRVVPGDQDEVDKRLDGWLDAESMERKIPGVDHHVVTRYAVEARLPDNSLAAGCCYETLWGAMHLSHFGCCKDRRGQGIGTAFLQHLADVARSHGCSRMYLETTPWQVPQSFYERHGFEPFGVQHDIPKEGSNRVYLEKML